MSDMNDTIDTIDSKPKPVKKNTKKAVKDGDTQKGVVEAQTVDECLCKYCKILYSDFQNKEKESQKKQKDVRELKKIKNLSQLLYNQGLIDEHVYESIEKIVIIKKTD